MEHTEHRYQSGLVEAGWAARCRRCNRRVVLGHKDLAERWEAAHSRGRVYSGSAARRERARLDRRAGPARMTGPDLRAPAGAPIGEEVSAPHGRAGSPAEFENGGGSGLARGGHARSSNWTVRPAAW